jgi:hypothetical protein
MAMDKDILGQALYDARSVFNDKTMDELVITYGSLEGVRLAIAKIDAEVIINHIKDHAEGKYQAGTLTAGATVVTGVGVNAAIKIS